MDNLIRALDAAETFVTETWRAVVQGRLVGGCPQLKFDTIQQRQKYIDSIMSAGNLDVPEANFFERRIIATAQIAQDTEMGKGPWDMKPMLLNGPKARMSLNGTVYNIIPFRHGVPGSTGANAHFKNMPADIYKEAKALKPTISVTAPGVRLRNHGMLYGGKLTGTEGRYPKQTKVVMFEQDGKIKSGQYTHKTGIYEGMIKIQAGYTKATQFQYMTFRMVSENSDPMSWWHPGRNAQPHLQFIIDYCRPHIEASLKEAAVSDLVDMTRFNVGMSIQVV